MNCSSFVWCVIHRCFLIFVHSLFPMWFAIFWRTSFYLFLSSHFSCVQNECSYFPNKKLSCFIVASWHLQQQHNGPYRSSSTIRPNSNSFDRKQSKIGTAAHFMANSIGTIGEPLQWMPNTIDFTIRHWAHQSTWWRQWWVALSSRSEWWAANTDATSVTVRWHPHVPSLRRSEKMGIWRKDCFFTKGIVRWSFNCAVTMRISSWPLFISSKVSVELT